MADTFTEVSKTGYFKRIIGSIIGMLVGVVLFFGSFVLLYVNEGRVNLADIAVTAVVIDATKPAGTTLTGSLVSASGEVTSEEMVGDGLFFNPDRYLAVKRVVEVYAWNEDIQSKSQSELGGSETTETTYTYKKEWTNNPEDSTRFHSPEGHQNIKPSLAEELFTPRTAKLGIYSFVPGEVTLPVVKPIPLQSGVVTLVGSSTSADFNYIYSPYGTAGSIGNPEIGDMRISYLGLRPDFTATLFAKLDGLNLEKYQTEDVSLYRLFASGHDEAIATLDTEYTLMTWILRAIGFLMMWIGLSLVFRPIAILADIVPMLGKFTGFVTGSIAFLAALVLSLVTIFVSIILHSFWLVMAVIILSGSSLWYFVYRKRVKLVTTTATISQPVANTNIVSQAAVVAPAAELLQYIKNELASGKTQSDIQIELERAGWSRVLIDEAFAWLG